MCGGGDMPHVLLYGCYGGFLGGISIFFVVA